MQGTDLPGHQLMNLTRLRRNLPKVPYPGSPAGRRGSGDIPPEVPCRLRRPPEHSGTGNPAVGMIPGMCQKILLDPAFARTLRKWTAWTA